MSGKESEKNAPLAEPLCSLMRWEAAAANGGTGTWIWQNFTSEHTQRANFDFVPGFSSALPPQWRQRRPLRLRKRIPPFMLRHFTPSCSLLASGHICKISSFYLLLLFPPPPVLLKTGPGLLRGLFPRSVDAGGCHTLPSAANPSEMSCPVRKIVKPSQRRAPCAARRFGVAGSWCLPGALGPNWDRSATPAEVPRLPSFPSTPSLSSFPLLSPAFFSLSQQHWQMFELGVFPSAHPYTPVHAR